MTSVVSSRAAAVLLVLCSALGMRATAQDAGASPPRSTVRAPTDPSVSPPLHVDPATIEGLQQHALAQRKLGFYAVLLPPDYDAPKNRARRYPLVVILHGGASSEIRHGKLADAFGRNDVIYVVPRGAYPNEPVILKEQRMAWSALPTYPVVWGDKDGPRFPKAEVDALDPSALHVAWIEQALADARGRYRIAPGKALLIGHSQGGLFAHLFAVRHPELVRAYLAYAGAFESVLKAPADARGAEILKQHAIQVTLVHRENDERVPVEKTRELAAFFAQRGVAHVLLVLPGGDHMLDPEVHAAARRFIDTHTRRK